MKLTDEELTTLSGVAEWTPRALVIGTMPVRDVVASLVAEVRASRSAPREGPRAQDPDAPNDVIDDLFAELVGLYIDWTKERAALLALFGRDLT